MMKGRLLIRSGNYRLTRSRRRARRGCARYHGHMRRSAHSPHRAGGRQSAAAVGDQVHVQLVGVLGGGDREHLVVRLVERGALRGTGRAARRPGGRACRPGSRAGRRRRSARRRRSCAPPREARSGTRSPRRAARPRASRGRAGRPGRAPAGRPGSAAPCVGREAAGADRLLTTSAGASRTSAQVGSAAQAGVGDVAVRVRGVLGEDRAGRARGPGRRAGGSRAPVHLAQAVADREDPRRGAVGASRLWCSRGHAAKDISGGVSSVEQRVVGAISSITLPLQSAHDARDPGDMVEGTFAPEGGPRRRAAVRRSSSSSTRATRWSGGSPTAARESRFANAHRVIDLEKAHRDVLRARLPGRAARPRRG